MDDREVSDNAPQDTGTLDGWSLEASQSGLVQCLGACCLVDGTCQVLTQADCGLNPGAIYQGDATICTPNPCPQPCQGPVDGDMNGDTLTNGSDIGLMVDAMLGTPTQNDLCRGDFDGSGGLDNGDTGGFITALLAP